MAGKRIQLSNNNKINSIIMKIQIAYVGKYGIPISRATAINIALDYFNKNAFRKIDKKE